MEKEKRIVTKFTLSSGKEVYMREPAIGDIEKVASIAGKDAGDNQALLQIKMQKEMVRQLLVQVSQEAVDAASSLEELFTYNEYMQVQMCLKKMQGDVEDLGNFQMEIVSFGDK